MSFARSKAEILAARDRREEVLKRRVRRGSPATIFLSLNLPGPDKNRSGAEALFAWAREKLGVAFPGLRGWRAGCDALGPYGLGQVEMEAAAAKRLCVEIESSEPRARLIDLDVYDRRANRVGRAELQLAPRRCLLCAQPASECVRTGRHDPRSVMEAADELLAPGGN